MIFFKKRETEKIVSLGVKVLPPITPPPEVLSAGKSALCLADGQMPVGPNDGLGTSNDFAIIKAEEGAGAKGSPPQGKQQDWKICLDSHLGVNHTQAFDLCKALGDTGSLGWRLNLLNNSSSAAGAPSCHPLGLTK